MHGVETIEQIPLLSKKDPIMTHRTWFWNRTADRYFRQAIADPGAYTTKLEMTQRLLRPDMRLLEFGCGTGGTALTHAPLVTHITGLDISPKMIGHANRQKADKGVENVDFHVGSIQDWPQSEEPYDAVLGLSILHLLADRQAVLKQVYAMLKPGGLFISSTACIKDMGGLIPRLLPLASRLGVLPILRSFTAEQLLNEIETVGFVIQETFHPGKDKALFIIARRQ